MDALNSQITTLDNKIGLLVKQGETQVQTSLSTKELQNQVEILKRENKEQQKQLAESKVNIEMAKEKINNMDEDKHKEEKEEHNNIVEIKDQPQFEDLNDKESHLRGIIIYNHSEKKDPGWYHFKRKRSSLCIV